MTYSLVNYYYLKPNKDKKFKNKNIYSYVDKHLKKKIYSINSGLLTNSFLREKQFKISAFSNIIKNVSLINTFLNKWGLLYIYPVKYNNQIISNLKKQNIFLKKYYFNQKLLNTFNVFKVKTSNSLVYKNIFKSFTLKKNKILLKKINQNKKIFKFHLINKVLYKYRWMSYYLDYKGSFFILKKKFIKKNIKLRLFRGKVKYLFYNFLKISNVLLKTVNFKNINYFLYGKLYIYITYCTYLYNKIFKIFNKFKFIRKNSFFGSYYFNRKIKLKIINNQIIQLKNKNLLFKNNKLKNYFILLNKNNSLAYYFYYHSIIHYNKFFSNYIKLKLYKNIFINQVINFIYDNQLFYYQNKILLKNNSNSFQASLNNKMNLKKCIPKGKWQVLENQVDKK